MRTHETLLPYSLVVTVFVIASAGCSSSDSKTATKLTEPPTDAEEYSIVSQAGNHGSRWIWTEPDGTLVARDSFSMRGVSFDQDETIHFGPDGMPDRLVARTASGQNIEEETFAITGGQATWKSASDSGSIAYTSPAYYIKTTAGLPSADLIERLLKTPDHSLPLLPSGKATAELLGERQVGSGDARRTIQCWEVTGISFFPRTTFWTTEDGKFFATLYGGGSLVITSGYEDELAGIVETEAEAFAAQSLAIAKRLTKKPTRPVAFTHVRAFLDGGRYAEDQTIVVDKGKITAVGSAVLWTSVAFGLLHVPNIVSGHPTAFFPLSKRRAR